jgi:hypothetical protein
MFVRALANELGERGIRVNTISPGVTDTDGPVLDQDLVEHLTGRTPLGRLGQPDDVADVVAVLASDDARWPTRRGGGGTSARPVDYEGHDRTPTMVSTTDPRIEIESNTKSTELQQRNPS